MVYLSSVWGMGETKSECHNTNSSSSFLQENDEEVALLPLKNQVSQYFVIRLRHCFNEASFSNRNVLLSSFVSYYRLTVQLYA